MACSYPNHGLQSIRVLCIRIRTLLHTCYKIHGWSNGCEMPNALLKHSKQLCSLGVNDDGTELVHAIVHGISRSGEKLSHSYSNDFQTRWMVPLLFLSAIRSAIAVDSLVRKWNGKIEHDIDRFLNHCKLRCTKQLKTGCVDTNPCKVAEFHEKEQFGHWFITR